MKRNHAAVILGSIKSNRKAISSRRNGLLGGRPRKVMSEQVDPLGLPIEILVEMANAIQKYTGLPGVIYFSTKSEMSNPQAHALGRIKWLHAGAQTTISIKAGKDGKRLVGGESKNVSKLEEFVVKNEELLWTYWNTPQDEADSAVIMAQFQKV